MVALQISNALAGEIKYPVAAIPDSLKKGMYAVIREDYFRFDILAVNKSSKTVHHVITILNEKAKDYATQTLYYDKNTKISSFKGVVYDAMGKVSMLQAIIFVKAKSGNCALILNVILL